MIDSGQRVGGVTLDKNIQGFRQVLIRAGVVLGQLIADARVVQHRGNVLIMNGLLVYLVQFSVIFNRIRVVLDRVGQILFAALYSKYDAQIVQATGYTGVEQVGVRFLFSLVQTLEYLDLFVVELGELFIVVHETVGDVHETERVQDLELRQRIRLVDVDVQSATIILNRLDRIAQILVIMTDVV